jgi:magnesium transporter
MRRSRGPRHGRRRAHKAGLPPGTPVYTGDVAESASRITAYDYDRDRLEVLDCKIASETQRFRDTVSPTWVLVEGLGDAATIQRLCEVFDLHALTHEDILNVAQRPKLEDFGKYLFIVLDALESDAEGDVQVRQISLVVGKNFLLTFTEGRSELFKGVVEALQSGKGRVRGEGIDYLAYRVIDVIVDQYFLLVDRLAQRIEALEDTVLTNPTRESRSEVYTLKRAMLTVRRSVWPLREVLGALERGDSTLVTAASRIFFRDVYDHTVSVVEMVESNRELLSGIHDLYLSSLNNRLNEVMKVLTVIATIFMPMTFVASIYGMNFKHMPELDAPWGYPAALGVMALIGVGLWLYFRLKKWT